VREHDSFDRYARAAGEKGKGKERVIGALLAAIEKKCDKNVVGIYSFEK
jgi:hypothetical protein